MKTVRQIAEEIGVSKQAVFQKMKREPLSTDLRGLTEMTNGRLMISVDGEELIKSAFLPFYDKSIGRAISVPSTEFNGLIAVLQATIDTLQGQLEVKDRLIEQQAQTITQMSDALAATQQTAAAAQALHAGTMHQQLLSGKTGAKQKGQKSHPVQKRSWIIRFFGDRH